MDNFDPRVVEAALESPGPPDIADNVDILVR